MVATHLREDGAIECASIEIDAFGTEPVTRGKRGGPVREGGGREGD